jgi:hypothetical protein
VDHPNGERTREGARAAGGLRTPADLLDLLAEQVAAVRADRRAGAVAKARAVGYLAGVALKALEADTLQARVEALELVLKQRDGGKRP